MPESIKETFDKIRALPRKKKIIPRVISVFVLLVSVLMLTQGSAFQSIAGNDEGYFAVLKDTAIGNDYEILFFDPDGNRTGHLSLDGAHTSYHICCFEENLLVRKGYSSGCRLYDFYGNYLGDTEYPGRIDNKRYIGDLFVRTAEFKRSAFGLKEYILLYRENGTVTVDISDSSAFVRYIILAAVVLVHISAVYYITAYNYYKSDEYKVKTIVEEAAEEKNGP